MSNRNSLFKRGSGVYNCACCKRATRATGRGDNEYVRLCAECYELAGYENEIQDGGELSDRAKNEVVRLVERVYAAGGVPDLTFFDFVTPRGRQA